MTDPRPFWLDWEYDRESADTGTRSRFGNYLSMNAKAFADIWHEDPSVEFAATAWRIASGPIMSPPLVHSHPRVMSAKVERSDWDGEMVADVRLVSPRPQGLFNVRTADERYYRDYEINAWDEYEGVSEEDLTRDSFMFAEVRLLWQLPKGKLPVIKEIPTGHDALFRQAVECLDVLVWALNREVRPVIDQLGN